jgi:hypothetical protein
VFLLPRLAKARPASTAIRPWSSASPLAEGAELHRDRVNTGEEVFYLSFEEDPGAGLFVHSSVFRGAAWEGSVLRIDLGTVTLRLEPERD